MVKKDTPEGARHGHCRVGCVISLGKAADRDGAVLAVHGGMSLATGMGRSMAVCLHPMLAWRRARTANRIAIVVAWFSASYVAALAALLAWP